MNRKQYWYVMFFAMNQCKRIYNEEIKDIEVYSSFTDFYYRMKRNLWFKWDDGIEYDQFKFWGVDINLLKYKLNEVNENGMLD